MDRKHSGFNHGSANCKAIPIWETFYTEEKLKHYTFTFGQIGQKAFFISVSFL